MIRPVFLGGPRHGDAVPELDVRHLTVCQAVEMTGPPWDDITRADRFRLFPDPPVYVTYRPETFVWHSGGPHERVLIWVDTRLCVNGKNRLMVRLAHELRWAPVMIRFPL